MSKEEIVDSDDSLRMEMLFVSLMKSVCTAEIQLHTFYLISSRKSNRTSISSFTQFIGNEYSSLVL